MGHRRGLQIGVDLLDDRVVPMHAVDFHGRMGLVEGGEHRVVAVDGEQLALLAGVFFGGS